MSPEIPGFHIVREIGTGSLATVYLAVQEDSGQKVALKVFATQFANDEKFSESFLKMAQVAEAVSQPAIVKVYGGGNAGEYHFLAMEYLEGGSLRDRLKQGLTASAATQVAYAVAKALAYIHARSLFHGDIKPENILFRKDGTVALTDFGVASVLEEARCKDASGGILDSSAPYVSLEQAMARMPDDRSDIYSLGAVFYEMLAGEPLHPGNTSLFSVIKNAAQPVPPLPDTLAAFQPVLNTMLAKQPDDRYQHGSEVVDALSSFLESAPDVVAPASKVKEEMAPQQAPLEQPRPVSKPQPNDVRFSLGDEAEFQAPKFQEPELSDDWFEPEHTFMTERAASVRGEPATAKLPAKKMAKADEEDEELALTRKLIDEIISEGSQSTSESGRSPRARHHHQDSESLRGPRRQTQTSVTRSAQKPDQNALRKPILAMVIVFLLVGASLFIALRDESGPLQGKSIPAALSSRFGSDAAATEPKALPTDTPLVDAEQAEDNPDVAPSLESSVGSAFDTDLLPQDSTMENASAEGQNPEWAAESGVVGDNTQLDTQPGPTETERLLQLASEAMLNNQLMAPIGDSAFEYYEKVLRLEPGNDDAIAGLVQIVNRKLATASEYLNNGELESAKEHADMARLVADMDGMSSVVLWRVKKMQNIVSRISELDTIREMESWVPVISNQSSLTPAQLNQAYDAYMKAMDKNASDPRLNQVRPAYARAFYAMGNQYLEQDKLDLAKDMITKGLLIEPNNRQLRDLENRWVLMNDARLWLYDGDQDMAPAGAATGTVSN